MSNAHESSPRTTLQSRNIASRLQIKARITALALYCPTSPMTDDESRVWLDGWCEDLAHLSDAEVAYGCARYRRSGNTFFPTPGVLLALCKPEFGDKPARSRGRIINGCEQPWGGNCQCDRCMKKTPSPEFFHAGNADHTRDARIRNELDYDMERRLGYDPKKGDPALDDTIERDRSPEDLKAAMASARTKYPRAFNPGKPEWTADRAPIAYMPMTPERKAELLANLDKRIIEGNPG